MVDGITVRKDDAVATLVLDRPDVRNAITLEMYTALPDIVADLDRDRRIKVVVVRGAGEHAFAAGADIKEFGTVRADSISARAYNERVAAAERALADLSKTSVAMVHGYCIGGGCGLALACDVRLCDDRARFGITPAKLGLVYGLESTKRLVDLVGPARAKWMLMTGLQVPADDALRIGLVEQVTTTEALERETAALADLLCSRAQFSVRATKTIIGRIVRGQSADDEETAALRNSSFDTDDYAEGVRAFLERRDPVFRWT